MTAFGDYLRAIRMGFHWSKTLQAYLRIGVLERWEPAKEAWREDDAWLIEVAPSGCLPSRSATRGHVRWWEDADPERLIRLSSVLSGMGLPDGYLSFTLGMDGAAMQR